jgi:hypothetical protein
MDNWKQNLDIFFFLGREASANISLSDGSASPHKLRCRVHEGGKEQSGDDYLGRGIPETGNFHLRDLAFELKDLWD